MTHESCTNPPLTALPLAVLAVACLLAVAACAPERSPPNIVLVVIDALRADHLGVYGYHRDTSPNIDRLATSGTLFLNAGAPSSWTKPSIASLFTSRQPSEHGAVSFRHHLDDDLPTLAELLRARGYRTLGVSGNFVHITVRNGFAKGFDLWNSEGVAVDEADEHSLLTLSTADGGRRAQRAPGGPEINRRVEEMLGSLRGEPLFLYVHYMEPHPGFDPPPHHLDRFLRNPGYHATAPLATASYVSTLAKRGAHPAREEVERLIDLYDAEIAAVDEAFGGLLRILAAAGVAEPVVVIVADHGEEFLDHDGWFHGRHLHGEVLDVPLIIRDPRREYSPREIAEPVDLLDVAPTLLALAGAAAGTGFRGRNLTEEGARRGQRDIVAELHPDPLLEDHLGTRSHRFAVRRGPWKLIAHADGRMEVYRKDRDPGETDPLGARATGVPADLARAGSASWRPPEAGSGSATPPAVEPETRDALRELGYAE
jgi:arylsulfatase A-like enzyme